MSHQQMPSSVMKVANKWTFHGEGPHRPDKSPHSVFNLSFRKPLSIEIMGNVLNANLLSIINPSM